MSDDKTSTTNANQYGGEVSVYGCQPCTMDPPSVPTIPWYPSQTTPIGTAITITPVGTPIGTPINPPRECKYCEHLFATVEAFNDHLDRCRDKYRMSKHRRTTR